MSVGSVHWELSGYCCKIAKLFRPGCKITILVRNPDHGRDHSADLLVGDDSLTEVIAAVSALKEMQERKLTLEDALGTANETPASHDTAPEAK